MRRLAVVLVLAILGLVAGALTAHALHAQTGGPYAGGAWTPQTRADSLRERAALDSLLVADAGCVVRRADDPTGWTSREGRPVAPATSQSPPVTLRLDSAGVRVTEAWQAPGVRDDGTVRWCPVRDVALTLTRARFLLSPGDPPFGQWRDSLDVGSMWRIGRPESVWPDSVAVDSLWRRAGAFATWRSALAVLAPRFHDAPPLPPVVAPPPTTQPPIAPVPLDPCAGGYAAWLDQPAVRGHDVERRDDARVIDPAGRCVGVVSVRRTSAGDRFVVAYPPCPGPSPQPWRLFGTTYVSRTTAIDRAARGLACPPATPPATRAPDARNLPTPLPFTRTRGPA